MKRKLQPKKAETANTQTRTRIFRAFIKQKTCFVQNKNATKILNICIAFFVSLLHINDLKKILHILVAGIAPHPYSSSNAERIGTKTTKTQI